eukprot:CAMPEP_0197936730 /NCGR_PEP_ID=MMETSP1439-20131203/115420_1 /TAXON_ID=66791 /ORGANISM="Gonyaulax spinifera, Strain CCMP409" /LENGTH=182 /DNA_ID=CAMNT_0043559717 /DNA_START=49 /DNA_END=595 /DNA_ORIENTATION=-
MTTVGFGDVGPKTDLGRVVGTVTMLSGILLIALPIAIIGRKFQEAYEDFMEKQGTPPLQQKCSHTSFKGTMSLADMGRRLKRMRHTDPQLNALTRELADDVEEMLSVQKEIVSMQNGERDKQQEIVKHFQIVLDHVTKLSEASRNTQALYITGALRKTAKPAKAAGAAPSAAKKQVEALGAE